MVSNSVMHGFPPDLAQQVTLANWRQGPFNRWAFHHVEEIVPTATIEAEPRFAVALEAAPRSISHVGFEDVAGQERSFGRFLTDSCADALVVLQRGRIVHEWYDAGCSATSRHIVFSVSKSLTGTAAGIAVERGQLDPDSLVTQYVPEAEGFAYGDCTVRHLLDMTVSTDFDESDPTNPTFLRYRQSMGWNPLPPEAEPVDMRSFLASLGKGDRPHGEVFHYVSPNSDMLGWVLERATGRRFADYFAQEIWQKLGAGRDALITVDRLGAPRTAGGICVAARDLALFGEMVRCRGIANGRQIVPGWWIDDILDAGDPAAWANGNFAHLISGGTYRSKWYKLNDDRGTFCAIGIHGQWIYVDQAADLVIAKLSSQPEAADDELEATHLKAFAALARHLG